MSVSLTQEVPSVPPGHPIRLKARARMTDAAATRLETTAPLTYRLTLRTDAGATVSITAPLDEPWPTA